MESRRSGAARISCAPPAGRWGQELGRPKTPALVAALFSTIPRQGRPELSLLLNMVASSPFRRGNHGMGRYCYGM